MLEEHGHLRSHEASEDAVFQIGPYTFKPGAKLLVGERGSKIENHTQVGAKKPRDEGSAPQQGDENTFDDEIPF